MRLRTLLAAVPAALPMVVAPGTAYAVEPLLPYCVGVLAHAAPGVVATCFTIGPEPIAGSGLRVLRTVYVTAETGTVQATLRCDQQAPVTTTVVAPNAGSMRMWDGSRCSLTLTSMANSTNGAGVSYGGPATDVLH